VAVVPVSFSVTIFPQHHLPHYIPYGISFLYRTKHSFQKTKQVSTKCHLLWFGQKLQKSMQFDFGVILVMSFRRLVLL